MAVPETLERNIYFYAADVGVDDSGRLLPFDPTAPLQHIDNMPLRGPDRRLPLPDDRASYCNYTAPFITTFYELVTFG